MLDYTSARNAVDAETSYKLELLILTSSQHAT